MAEEDVNRPSKRTHSFQFIFPGILKPGRELVSRPFGATTFSVRHPRLAPWAIFLRAYAVRSATVCTRHSTRRFTWNLRAAAFKFRRFAASHGISELVEPPPRVS